MFIYYSCIIKQYQQIRTIGGMFTTLTSLWCISFNAKVFCSSSYFSWALPILASRPTISGSSCGSDGGCRGALPISRNGGSEYQYWSEKSEQDSAIYTSSSYYIELMIARIKGKSVFSVCSNVSCTVEK